MLGKSRFTYTTWAFPAAEFANTALAYKLFCKEYYARTGFRCDMPTVGFRLNRDRSALLSPSFDSAMFTLSPLSTQTDGWDDFVLDFADFGIDCKSYKLDGVADPAYVIVGCDGSGDMYLLDTRTGKVHIYRHEESKLDKKAFDSLDTFAFAALRAEAALRGMIPQPALKKAFKALGIDAGAALLP